MFSPVRGFYPARGLAMELWGCSADNVPVGACDLIAVPAMKNWHVASRKSTAVKSRVIMIKQYPLIAR